MMNMHQATAPAALRELTTIESLAVSGGVVSYCFRGPHGAGGGSRAPSAVHGVPVAPPLPVAPAPTRPPLDLNFQR